LNWLDLVILVFVALLTFLGFRKGFLRKVLGIAGLIFGFILAIRFYDLVSNLFLKLTDANESLMRIIAFLFIIAAVYSLAIWIARFMTNINPSLSKIDKMAGAILGFVEGLLITSILLVNLSFINYPDVKIRETSALYTRVYSIAPFLFDKIISYSPSLKDMYLEYKSKLLNKNVPNSDNRR
jgi:uncharacterized membrane protein required for colicin V production